jgi:hypothetical protein
VVSHELVPVLRCEHWLPGKLAQVRRRGWPRLSDGGRRRSPAGPPPRRSVAPGGGAGSQAVQVVHRGTGHVRAIMLPRGRQWPP